MKTADGWLFLGVSMSVLITGVVILAFWSGVYLCIKAGVRGVRDPLFRRQAIARCCVGLLLMAPATWLLLLESNDAKVATAPRQLTSETNAASKIEPKGQAFPLTPKQFAESFNTAAKGSRLRAEVVEISDATAKVNMSQNCAAVLTLQGDKVSGGLVLGTPGNSVDASADVMLCLLYSVAGVRPEMSKGRRMDIVTKLTEELPQSASVVDDGIKFSLSQGDAGVLFSMVPAS